MLSSTLRFLALGSSITVAVGCANDKPTLDPTALDAIDVNETGKEDSFRRPTLKGPIAMNETVPGRVTRSRAFHAYNFTAGPTPELVRLDVRSAIGDDLFLAVYRRAGSVWVLADYNDDCGDGSLNACLALPTTAGEYRLVVTTFDAVIGAPIPADYELAVSCKDGGCLPQEVACGARAGDTCAADEYCRFELNEVCGRADAQGVCAPRPEICTQQFEPVCGCDNVTYSNGCMAAAAGVGVLALGECVPEQ